MKNKQKTISETHFLNKTVQIIQDGLSKGEYNVSLKLVDWCIWFSPDDWALKYLKLQILLKNGCHSDTCSMLERSVYDLKNYNEEQYRSIAFEIKKERGELFDALYIIKKSSSAIGIAKYFDFAKQIQNITECRNAYKQLYGLFIKQNLPVQLYKNMLMSNQICSKHNIFESTCIALVNQILDKIENKNTIMWELFKNRFIMFDSFSSELTILPTVEELGFPLETYVPEIKEFAPLINVATYNSISINKKYLKYNKNNSSWDISDKNNDKVIDVYIPDELFSKVDPNEHQTRSKVRQFFSSIIKAISLIESNIIINPLYQYAFGIKKEYSNSQLSIAYHTIDKSGKSLNYKESYLPDYFYLDANGYSGWSAYKFNPNMLNVSDNDVDEFYLELNKKYIENKISKYSQPDDIFSTNRKYVFIALQLPHDSVAIHAHIRGIDLADIISSYYENTDTLVVIKRHPLCKSGYISERLETLKNRKNTILSEASVHSLIENAECIFTVNSGVGFEALLRLKPVVVSGTSDYASVCTEVRSEEELLFILSNNQHLMIDKQRIKLFLYDYLKNNNTQINDINSIKQKIEKKTKSTPIIFGTIATYLCQKNINESSYLHLQESLIKRKFFSSAAVFVNIDYLHAETKKKIILNAAKALVEANNQERAMNLCLLYKKLYPGDKEINETYYSNLFQIGEHAQIINGIKIDKNTKKSVFKLYIESLIKLDAHEKCLDYLNDHPDKLDPVVHQEYKAICYEGLGEITIAKEIISGIKKSDISTINNKLRLFIKKGDIKKIDGLLQSTLLPASDKEKKPIIQHELFSRSKHCLTQYSDINVMITDVPFWRLNTGSCQRVNNLYLRLKEKTKLPLMVLYIGYMGNIDYIEVNRRSEILLIPLTNYRSLYQDFDFNMFHLACQIEKNEFSRFISIEEINYYRTCILHLSKNINIKTVIVEYIWLTDIVTIFDSDTCKIVDLHDLQFERVKSLELSNINLKYSITQDDELKAISFFNYAIAISKHESDILKNLIPSEKVLYYPHLIDMGNINTPKKECEHQQLINLLFIGGTQDPNVQGINWFIKNIMPKLGSISVKLNVYGRVCEKIKTKDKNVSLCGFIKDLNTAYSSADIVIAPILSGSGLKIKSVEALSFGMPLISTSEGARGLDDEDSNNFIIADDESSFAESIIELSQNRLKLDELSKNAKKYIFKYNNEHDFNLILDIVNNNNEL